MSTFLELLPLELKQVKRFIEPDSDVAGGETIVGDMSDEHKALYSLTRYIAKEASDIQSDLLICSDNEEEKKAMACALAAKANLINDLFWIVLKNDLSLWSCPEALGVRRGFKVVTYRPKPKMPDFLSGFFGPQRQ